MAGADEPYDLSDQDVGRLIAINGLAGFSGNKHACCVPGCWRDCPVELKFCFYHGAKELRLLRKKFGYKYALISML
jgi:hypothetical protein